MKKIFICFLLFIIIGYIFSQNVTNVESRQVGNNIEITYNLDKEANIEIQITENGYSFTKIYSVNGDVGRNIPAGRKKITWDVLAERDKLQGDNIAFRVIASESSASIAKKEREKAERKKADRKKQKNNNYGVRVPFGFNLNFPLGGLYEANTKYSTSGNAVNYDFYVGYLGKKIGLVAKFKTNFIFHDIDNNNATNMENFTGSYYTIEESSVTRISAILELAVRLSGPVFMYAGVGYGYRSQLLDVMTYSPHPILGTISEGKKYFYYDRYKSVEFDLGLLICSRIFTYTAGASCMPFRVGGGKPYFELHVGVGFAF